MKSQTKFVENMKSFPNLTEAQKNRMTEILFYTVIRQIEANRKAAAAPYGTSTPKVLAAILKGINPEMIDYAYRSMSTTADTPTTQERVVALKYFGISANRSPWNPTTYYKWWNRWHDLGCPIKDTVLSDLQIAEVKKFLKFFKDVFYGDKSMVGSLTL